MQGGSEVTLSAHATLTSTTTKQVWARPPIDVDFQVLMFTASGLIVRFLKVFEKSSYQSVKWVRYLTKASGSYQVRVSEFVLSLEVGLVLITTFGCSSEVDIRVYFIRYFIAHLSVTSCAIGWGPIASGMLLSPSCGCSLIGTAFAHLPGTRHGSPRTSLPMNGSLCSDAQTLVLPGINPVATITQYMTMRYMRQ